MIYRFIGILLLLTTTATAAHFENPVDLTIKIEDPNMYTRVKEVKFDGNEIKLDESDMFKPRKVYTQKLIPGRYHLTWSTEKSNPKWGEQAVTDFQKIVVIEGGDSVIRINIRGETISLY